MKNDLPPAYILGKALTINCKSTLPGLRWKVDRLLILQKPTRCLYGNIYSIQFTDFNFTVLPLIVKPYRIKFHVKFSCYTESSVYYLWLRCICKVSLTAVHHNLLQPQWNRRNSLSLGFISTRLAMWSCLGAVTRRQLLRYRRGDIVRTSDRI